MQIQNLPVDTLFTFVNGVSKDVFRYVGNNRCRRILFLSADNDWLPYEANFLLPVKPTDKVRPVAIRVVNR